MVTPQGAVRDCRNPDGDAVARSTGCGRGTDGKHPVSSRVPRALAGIEIALVGSHGKIMEVNS
jgi:hypothetical protein